MHVSGQQPEIDQRTEALHVLIGDGGAWRVVEDQQVTRNGQQQEQEQAQPAKAEREGEAQALTPHPTGAKGPEAGVGGGSGSTQAGVGGRGARPPGAGRSGAAKLGARSFPPPPPRVRATAVVRVQMDIAAWPKRSAVALVTLVGRRRFRREKR